MLLKNNLLFDKVLDDILAKSIIIVRLNYFALFRAYPQSSSSWSFWQNFLIYDCFSRLLAMLSQLNRKISHFKCHPLANFYSYFGIIQAISHHDNRKSLLSPHQSLFLVNIDEIFLSLIFLSENNNKSNDNMHR